MLDILLNIIFFAPLIFVMYTLPFFIYLHKATGKKENEITVSVFDDLSDSPVTVINHKQMTLEKALFLKEDYEMSGFIVEISIKTKKEAKIVSKQDYRNQYYKKYGYIPSELELARYILLNSDPKKE